MRVYSSSVHKHHNESSLIIFPAV